MNKRVAMIVSLFGWLAFCVGASAAYNTRLALQLVQPGDSAAWDSGVGGEAQFRVINENNVGFAASIGLQRWDVDGANTGPWFSQAGFEAQELSVQNNRVADFNAEGFTAEAAGGGEEAAMVTLRANTFSGVTASNPDVDGHATVIPLGLSGLLRVISSGPLSVVLEGGIRYLIIESSVEWSADYQTHGGTTAFGESGRRTGTAKIENAIVGLVGVDVIYELTRDIALIGGLAVQFDLQKAEVKSPGATSIGDVEMNAVTGHAGVLVRY